MSKWDEQILVVNRKELFNNEEDRNLTRVQ